MRGRKAVLILAVACVAVATTWSLLDSPVPGVDALAATKLSAAAAQLMLRSSEGRVPEDRWPAEIRRFNPEAVRVAPEGVYLKSKGFFVTEKGIFILSPRSSFQPVPEDDPSYYPLAGKVYRYEIRG